jgi:acyl dehydratase
MLMIEGAHELKSREGGLIGASDWLLIDQAAVDQFADVTKDHQWIHVDVNRARTSAFGGTIVHGYFALALVPRLAATVYKVTGFRYGLNYGLNRVRFPAPLPVGSEIRVRIEVISVTSVSETDVQLAARNTVECSGLDKPVCVAETLTRYVA